MLKVLESIFDPIIGYEDVKRLFVKSLEADKPTHILMAGPPSSAKTVLLLEISRLSGAFYLLGGSTRKAGFINQLFNLKPQYVLLDETDKMNNEDLTALLSLMETGIVKETKYGKTREMCLQSNVYGACNTTRQLPTELLSRFQFKLHFKAYTKEEFIEVSRRVLLEREKTENGLAIYITEEIAEISRDIRDCVGIARLARTREDVDFLIRLIWKYSKETMTEDLNSMHYAYSETMKRKTITVRDDQAEWIKKYHINFSRFIQDAIDREMKKLAIR